MCIEISYFCDAAILNSTDFMFLFQWYAYICTYTLLHRYAYIYIYIYIPMRRCMLLKRRDDLNKKKKMWKNKQRVANYISMKNK